MTTSRMTDLFDAKTMDLRDSIAPLIAQTRAAILHGVDQEFQEDKEIGPLEVTAAQFAIIANVLKSA